MKLNKQSLVLAVTSISASAALLMPFSASALQFKDVDSNNEHLAAITYLSNNYVLAGYPDGTFKPKATINRAEMMKILVAGQGFDPDETKYKNCFPDVTTDWYARYVCYAKEQGWIQGNPDGTFAPAKTLNHAEGSKMVVTALDLNLFQNPTPSNFSDVAPTDWFADYASIFRTKNLLDNATFAAGNGMNRAEVAESIFRAIVINQDYKPKFEASMYLSFDAKQPIQLVLHHSPYPYKTITEKTSLYEINVGYVETGKPQVDAKIKTFVDGWIKDIKDAAEADKDIMPGPYTLTIIPDYASFDENIQSVQFVAHFYTGGAHPNSGYKTFTFDTSTQKIITLSDIFTDLNEGLKAVSERSKTELKASLEDAYLEGGVDPEEANFQNFTLQTAKDGSTSITFYFDPYQVAVYAAGPQQVTIPLVDIAGLLTQQFHPGDE